MLNLDISAQQPVTDTPPISGWKLKSIEECHEPLVAMSSFNKPQILVSPYYFQQGIPGAINEIYLRTSVAERLITAASRLPPRYRLLLWDGWRPLTVQRTLFDQFYEINAAQWPEEGPEVLKQKTEVYVGLPSDNPLHPSPHHSGGSIDLTLTNEYGHPLPMGTAFDAFTSLSQTRSLEKKCTRSSALSDEEQEALENRRRLFHLMIEYGFTNYCEEWWHFDYGNQFWGTLVGKAAIYGPCQPESIG